MRNNYVSLQLLGDPGKIRSFKLSLTLVSKLKILMANFWWGQKDNEKKIHYIARSKMCIPKSQGGLGFKKLSSFNMALLAKQGWLIHQQEDSLLHRLYKARCFPDNFFLKSQFGAEPILFSARDLEI